MPRLNIFRTNEVRAWNAHHAYLEEHFDKDQSINEGWGQGPGFISSKVYGEGVAETTWPEDAEETRLIEPDEFDHSFQAFDDTDPIA